jgi:hypothetical protein
MDMSGGWEPGVPDRGARAQGAWRQGARSQDMGAEGVEPSAVWNPGSGVGPAGVFDGDWTAATAAARELGRRVARVLAIVALAGLAALAGLITLVVLAFQHGGTLAALLVLLGVPALLVTLGVATALWVSRRAWRRGMWLEAVPLAVGAPWLSRVIWAVRAALVGRAFWRIGQRVRRPWRQPRTGDLSGTTR